MGQVIDGGMEYQSDLIRSLRLRSHHCQASVVPLLLSVAIRAGMGLFGYQLDEYT